MKNKGKHESVFYDYVCYEFADKRKRRWKMALIGKDADNNGYICECESCGMEFHAYTNTVKCCKQRKTVTCESCGGCYHYVCHQANDSSCPYCRYARTNSYKYIEIQSTCDLCGESFMKNKREHANTCNALKTYTCKHCNGVFITACRNDCNSDYCSLSCCMKESEKIKENHMNQRMKNNGKLAFNTDKQKKTMMERYGVEVPCRNDEIKQKAISVQKSRNDGKLAFNTDKQRMTMIQKYGAPTTLQSPVLIRKYENTMLSRYGAARPASVPEIENRILGSIIANNGYLFGTGNPISKTNIEFVDKLSRAYMNAFNAELDYEYEYNIDNSFYDVRLCKHDILIDLNPTVTHNVDLPYACRIKKCEQPCEQHKSIDSDYHLNRSILAYKNGYNLINVYDNDDVNEIIGYVISLCRGSYEHVDYHHVSCEHSDDNSFHFIDYDELLLFTCMIDNDGFINEYDSYHGCYYDNFDYIIRNVQIKGYAVDFDKNTSNRIIPDGDMVSSIEPVLVHSEHDDEFNVDMDVYGSDTVVIE